MRKISVVPYNPAWADRFAEVARELGEILAREIVACHHVGSTAVPGLAAKPIVDLLVEVGDVERIDHYNPALRAHGYLVKGAFGIPGRRFFIKGSEEERVAHVHMFTVGDPAIARHLAFRNYLRAHPEAAAAYGGLKQQLAREHPHDVEGYMAGKHAFVQALEAEALAWASAREQADGR